MFSALHEMLLIVLLFWQITDFFKRWFHLFYSKKMRTYIYIVFKYSTHFWDWWNWHTFWKVFPEIYIRSADVGLNIFSCLRRVRNFFFIDSIDTHTFENGETEAQVESFFLVFSFVPLKMEKQLLFLWAVQGQFSGSNLGEPCCKKYVSFINLKILCYKENKMNLDHI